MASTNRGLAICRRHRSIDLRKGIDFFISAADIVHRAIPNRKIRFGWVGKGNQQDQDYMDYLEEQIERSGLADVFLFIEEVEDLERIYDRADIYFLSSRLDPLPNVAIDFGAQGYSGYMLRPRKWYGRNPGRGD